MSQMYQSMGDKDTCIPLFYREPAEDKKESKAKGYPVFHEVDMVKILMPGSRDEVTRPVDEKDKGRWPNQWAQFQNKEKQIPDGTPIDELSTASMAEKAVCKALHVMTIEALAGYPETTIHKLGPGGHAFKRKAVAYLESRGKDGHVAVLHEQIAELRAEVAKLRSKDGERTADDSR